MILLKRKLIKIGNSYAVTLPKYYREQQRHNKDGMFLIYCLEKHEVDRVNN